MFPEDEQLLKFAEDSSVSVTRQVLSELSVSNIVDVRIVSVTRDGVTRPRDCLLRRNDSKTIRFTFKNNSSRPVPKLFVGKGN